MTPQERFEQFCIPEPNTGCTLWLGQLSSRHYGTFWLNGKSERAHRVAWGWHSGQPVPPGLFVCHRCDNPACVNPRHLFLGTPLDNMLDKCAKGRQWRPTGEKHWKARLSDADVDEIRRLHSEGWTQAALSRRYGISDGYASDLVKGKVRKQARLLP